MKKYFYLFIICFLLSGLAYSAEENLVEPKVYLKTGSDVMLELPAGADVIIHKDSFSHWVQTDPRLTPWQQGSGYYIMSKDGEKMLVATKDIGPNLQVIKFFSQTEQNKNWFESEAWGSADAKYEFQRKFKSYADYAKE